MNHVFNNGAALTARFYPEAKFGGFTDVDGTIAFYHRVNALLTPASSVVDFGCGRGSSAEDPVALRRELRSLRGKVKSVIGIDVDAAGRKNQNIDEFRLIEAERSWPIEDRHIDLVLCDYVMEHLPCPDRFFSEARRVLKPEGFVCIRTPNLLSYFGLASKLTPNRHHSTALRTSQPNRKSEDIFPTLYRCNTVFALRRTLRRHDFDAVVYGYDSEPGYLAFSKVACYMGVLHQRYAPRPLKTCIFAFGKRT